MANEFEFKTIEGFVTLEEATAGLVQVAQCIQRTHNNQSASRNRQTIQHLYDMRKASMDAYMDLIQQYIHQMPETKMQKTCGGCVDIIESANVVCCGNPMVYLNYENNVYHVKCDTPACGFFRQKKEESK